MTRYVTRRVDGSWQVQDSEFHGFIMGEYGPGSTGYQQARVAANSLNDQTPPAAPAPVNDLVTTNLRSPVGLRAWRRAHKLSQQKLADLLEVHKLTVLRWEQGQVPIPRTTELALLYLDRSLSDQILSNETPSAAAV